MPKTKEAVRITNMPISKKLIRTLPSARNLKASRIFKFLTENKARYEIVHHRTVYTAYDKAATLKLKPNIIGKTLVLKMDKLISMVLIPGNKNLDKNKFKRIANDWQKKKEEKPVKKVDFMSERIMKNKFKGVKIGAIPPFGNLWGFPTFIDKGLLKNPKVIVNGGDYNFSIKITGAVLKKLIPDLVIGNFSKPR